MKAPASHVTYGTSNLTEFHFFFFRSNSYFKGGMRFKRNFVYEMKVEKGWNNRELFVI